jgi:ABC-2 type transport system permease protein
MSTMPSTATATGVAVGPPCTPTAAAALLALTGRSLRTCLREPSLSLSPIVMSAFFLFIYHGQLAEAMATLVPGRSYAGFLVPLVLLTTAFTGGAIAGQLLLRDVDSGYHARLALTPSRRGLAAAAHTLAGVVVIAVQAVALLLLAWPLGLEQPHGVIGLTVVTGLAVTAGAGFLLLAVTAALVSRTAAAVNLVTYVFFPLSFLTPMFVPRDRLTGWMAVAADLNPLTYLLEGMRDAFTPGWSLTTLGRGGIAALVVLLLGLAAVVAGLRRDATEVDR